MIMLRVTNLRRSAAALAVAGVLMTGCLPYAVGSTARTAPAGSIEQMGTFYSIPGGFESDADSLSAPLFGVDAEFRYGIDERSDVGLRIPSMSGVVLNYKRRLTGDDETTGPAVALMGGGGFVNLGEHALLELSLLVSGHDRGTLTPYGGLRGMQVIPMSRYAVSDRPTIGGFLGLRLGRADFGVSPELGVYYDPSALDLRERRVILVPSVSVHGGELMRLVGEILDWPGRAGGRGR